MSKVKFYAVRQGSKTEIYTSWAECQKEIKGVSGALFKSFPSRSEAEEWLDLVEDKNEKLTTQIYVDGSFLEAGGPAGWGWVAIRDGVEIDRRSGKTPRPALSRNIDGELYAALDAAKWLFECKTRGTIVHDYTGIAHWAKGEWQAKSEIAKWYKKEIQPYLKYIQFEKVEAHSGDKWNDIADELAKSALMNVQSKEKIFSAMGRAPEASINYLISYALQNAEVLSLAAGLVDPKTFPVDRLSKASQKVFHSPEILKDLQYNSTQGNPELRQEVVNFLDRTFNEKLSAKDIIIGNGSQQILYLLCQVLIEPNDIVIVEDPSYYVFLDCLKQFGAKIIHLPCDNEGPILAELHTIWHDLKKQGELGKVKVLYTIPYCQNPTGRSYSKERKKSLTEMISLLQKESPFYIVEDAAYREISFFEDIPSFGQLGLDRGLYLYCGTFSKSLAPGLRIGYGIVDDELKNKMLTLKGSQDFGTSSLTQAIVREFLAAKEDVEQLQLVEKSYRKKADLMQQCLKQNLPSKVQWVFPKGGLYFWLELPEYMDTTMEGDFFKKCLDNRLLIVPGDLFYEGKKNISTLRLTYAFASNEEIIEGIHRLGLVVNSMFSHQDDDNDDKIG